MELAISYHKLPINTLSTELIEKNDLGVGNVSKTTTVETF